MSSKEKITIWEAKNNLNYLDHISPTDKRFVDLTSARGEYTLGQDLYNNLNIDNKGVLHEPPANEYFLFTGHIGCGKSTELARISSYLHSPKRYYAVELDCLKKLDITNLSYLDVLLALYSLLLECSENEELKISGIFLKELEKWYEERIITHTQIKGIKSDLDAGAKAKGGVPFLANLFATLTNKMYIGSTYREEVRSVVKETSRRLIESFNLLVGEVQRLLGRRIVFIIDGPDRLSGDDAKHFFLDDFHQLTSLQGLYIYCTPIRIFHEQRNLVGQHFTQTVRLPMLKVRDRDNRIIMDNFDVIREMIYKRVPEYLFDSKNTLDFLIRYSGGHIRDLLRLVDLSCSYRDDDSPIITKTAAERAVDALAKEYQYHLTLDDYRLLVKIDNDPQQPHAYVSEHSNELLHNLFILQYNNFFWKSHPVITTLEGYKVAQDEFEAESK